MKEKEFELLKQKALVFIYWCCKLNEGGYVEGGPKITPEGFDQAMDLIDGGLKINEEECLSFCEELKSSPELIPLIMEIQEIGLDGMKALEESLSKE
jgi:hypothetical protein